MKLVCGGSDDVGVGRGYTWTTVHGRPAVSVDGQDLAHGHGGGMHSVSRTCACCSDHSDGNGDWVEIPSADEGSGVRILQSLRVREIGSLCLWGGP